MKDGPPRIFDAHAQALHRARAARMAGGRFLAAEAVEGVRARLVPVNRTFATALLLGGHGGGEFQDFALSWSNAAFDAEERLETAGSFDLVVSMLVLHGLNDLPGALLQIRRALKPDGLFVAAMFGGATLAELRDCFATGEIATIGGITPRVAPMADVRELGALLQRAGFEMPVADVEHTTVRYRSFATLVNDLRLMGETSALAGRRPLRRATLAASLAHYEARHADADGRLRATFDIVYLTGWAAPVPLG